MNYSFLIFNKYDISARCMVNPVVLLRDEESAVANEHLEGQLELEEETITIAKLCYVFPLIDSIIRHEGMPYVLRSNCIQFLTTALNSRFIKV